MDDPHFEGEGSQSSRQGDEVSEQGEECPKEGGNCEVCTTGDEAGEQVGSRVLAGSVPSGDEPLQ